MKKSLVSVLITLSILFSFSCLSDAGSVGTSVDLSNSPQVVDPIDDNSYVVNVENPTDEEIVAQEEAKAAEEAAAKAAEEAAKLAAEEAAKKAAEEAAKKAAEKAAEEAEMAAKEAERAAEAAEKEAARIAAEEAKKAAEEAAKKAAEEEAARIAAEEAAKKAAEEAAKKAAEEEAAKKAAEEAAKKAAEEAARKAAEEAAEEEDDDAVLEPEFLAVSVSGNNTSTLGSSVSLSDYNILIDANNVTTGLFTVELDFEVVGQVKKNAIFLVEIENEYGKTIGGIFVKVKSTGRVTVRGIVKLTEVDQQVTLTLKHKNDKNAELLINGLRIGKQLGE